MSDPDVRVRLTAEGVAEVVGALRKVQTQAKAMTVDCSRVFATNRLA